MSWDVAPGQDEITQEWGCTSYSREWAAPWCPGGYYHAGIDLGFSGGGAAACFRPVYATRAGVVAAVGTFGYGDAEFYGGYLGPNAVCVKYEDGIYVWHGHLSAHSVSAGQRVAAGDQLGAIGNLGASSECHLHVEARRDGPAQGVANQAAAVVDPRPYLNREEVDPLAGANIAALKVELVRIACRAALGRFDQSLLNQYAPAIADDLSNLNQVLGGIWDSQEAQNWQRRLQEATAGQP